MLLQASLALFAGLASSKTLPQYQMQPYDSPFINNQLAQDLDLESIFTWSPDDMHKLFPELCAQNDYQFETYQITTEDDYVLTLFRIPGKIDEEITLTDTPKPPILFQHGLLDSADAWIMNEASKAPPFVAVDAGYDAWLGNLRGNKYSRQHLNLDPDNDAEFWDFSFPEHAKYDLPAMVKEIRDKTGDQQIAYVGHSMGTTIMFYNLINQFDFVKESFSVFIALAPVTKIPHHESTLVSLIAKGLTKWEGMFHLFGINEIFEPTWLQSSTISMACGMVPEICKLTAGIVATQDIDQDDEERFQVYMGHYPSGTSAKSMFHLVQNLKEDQFQEYDYQNKKQNKKHYGVSEAPHLDLSEIEGQFPIAMFIGQDDELANPTDSREVRDLIGEESVFHYQEQLGGHLSFHVGKDMSYFTETCMNILKEYSPLPQEQE